MLGSTFESFHSRSKHQIESVGRVTYDCRDHTITNTKHNSKARNSFSLSFFFILIFYSRRVEVSFVKHTNYYTATCTSDIQITTNGVITNVSLSQAAHRTIFCRIYTIFSTYLFCCTTDFSKKVQKHNFLDIFVKYLNFLNKVFKICSFCSRFSCPFLIVSLFTIIFLREALTVQKQREKKFQTKNLTRSPDMEIKNFSTESLNTAKHDFFNIVITIF